MPNYGWEKDKYDPDAVYHRPKAGAVPIPAVIDLLQLCPPVRDQDGANGCVGFAASEHLYTVAKSGNFKVLDIYSANWVWNGARFLEGTCSQNDGVVPDHAWKWLLSQGCLFEGYWPFKGFDPTPPSSLRMSQAIKYPNFQTVRVDNGLDGILSALAEGHTIAFGAPWPGTWEAGSTDILPIPTASTPIGGGHETLLHGAVIGAAYLDDQNSWGTGWSNKGHCKVPFEWIEWAKAQGGYDATYVIMTDPGPEPIPPKPKKKCWFFGGGN